MMRNRYSYVASCIGITVLVVLSLCARIVFAQDNYPSRPVTVIIPWGAGGGSDQLARKVAHLLEADSKATFPAVNVPGATGNTGMAKLLQSAADGYSMAVLTADTFYDTLAKSSPNWTLKDIVVLAVMIQQPSGFYVADGSKFKTWANFENAAKKASQPLKVAISGFGSPDDLTIAYLNEQGLKLHAVPYAKPAQRYAALLGGHVAVMYSPVGNVQTYVEQKQMRPLIFFSGTKLANFPTIPASKELGYDISLPQFRAFVMKAGTDPAKVKIIGNALARVYKSQDYQAYLKHAAAFDNSYVPPEKAGKFMQTQLDRMNDILKRLHGNATKH